MTGQFDELAQRVMQLCLERGVVLATAESCTGGMIAAALTEIPGSSRVVDCGFVTYSNEAKQRMLGVTPETLETYGAVSGETAREMAHGAIVHSQATLAVSVTGIAGPAGGSAEKPIGLVWIGLSRKGHLPQARRFEFEPTSRSFVRSKSVRTALEWVIEHLEAH